MLYTYTYCGLLATSRVVHKTTLEVQLTKFRRVTEELNEHSICFILLLSSTSFLW